MFSFASERWILKKLRLIETCYIFHLINVYSLVRNLEKVGFWNSLQIITKDYSVENCIIGGDFNTTLTNEEKKGGNIVRDPMGEKMLYLITDWDLNDIKPIHGKFTWSNKRTRVSNIAARLDQFLVHNFFLQDVLISSHIVASTIFDHKPISLIFYSPENFRPLPFKFNHV